MNWVRLILRRERRRRRKERCELHDVKLTPRRGKMEGGKRKEEEKNRRKIEAIPFSSYFLGIPTHKVNVKGVKSESENYIKTRIPVFSYFFGIPAQTGIPAHIPHTRDRAKRDARFLERAFYGVKVRLIFRPLPFPFLLSLPFPLPSRQRAYTRLAARRCSILRLQRDSFSSCTSSHKI